MKEKTASNTCMFFFVLTWTYTLRLCFSIKWRARRGDREKKKKKERESEEERKQALYRQAIQGHIFVCIHCRFILPSLVFPAKEQTES